MSARPLSKANAAPLKKASRFQWLRNAVFKYLSKGTVIVYFVKNNLNQRIVNKPRIYLVEEASGFYHL